jgi:capsule polysaccharide export protein KpsC/LpsZ
MLTVEWANETSVCDWWKKIALQKEKEMKSMASMIMFVSLEIWKKHNAIEFFDTTSLPWAAAIVVNKIKREARAWRGPF